MVASAAGTGQATAQGRDLKDATTPLPAHDWQHGAGHVDDAEEVCVHQRLEALGSQLLEGCNVAVSCVIHDDIESSEGVHGHLHRCLCRLLVRHVERSRANLIAIFLRQVFKAARVTSGCDETIARCEHSFGNVSAQTACAAGYQPDFRHKTLQSATRRFRIICISYVFLFCLWFVNYSQTAGNGIIGQGLRVCLDAGRLLRSATALCFFRLLLRFMLPRCQLLNDASKTCLLSNREGVRMFACRRGSIPSLCQYHEHSLATPVPDVHFSID